MTSSLFSSVSRGSTVDVVENEPDPKEHSFYFVVLIAKPQHSGMQPYTMDGESMRPEMDGLKTASTFGNYPTSVVCWVAITNRSNTSRGIFEEVCYGAVNST